MTWRKARRLEQSKSHSSLQEWQEPMEVQFGQPHLDSWGDDGAAKSGSCFQTYVGQNGDQK